MTVDLGLVFNDKIILIDVPGHQDFIKNMLSGVQSSIWITSYCCWWYYAQTKDDFDILKLLDVSGIILINKIDLVDSDMLELVKLEISELLVDSKYENAGVLEINNWKYWNKKIKRKVRNFKCNNKKSSGPFRIQSIEFFL